MKYSWLSLTFFLLTSCNSDNINDKAKRNEHWGWLTDAKTGKGKWLPVGESFSANNGSYTLFYFNGAVYETGKIVNGKHVDTTYLYDMKGNLIVYHVFRTDIDYYPMDGYNKVYYPNGRVWYEGNINNHSKDKSGRWTTYYKNGNHKLKKYNFAKDTGNILHYYETGQLKDSSIYITSKDVSYSIAAWYENGNIQSIGEWKGELQSGTVIRYYESGQKRDSGRYNKGKEDGFGKLWYANGQLRQYGEYKNGKPDGNWKEFYETGELKSIIVCKSGEQVEIKEFDKKGNLLNYRKNVVKTK